MTEVLGIRGDGGSRVLAPNVTAVASGKGGVGKTWLAISLSHALARAGRRVLLFDGDLGLANVDIQLGLQAANDLGGVLAGRYRLAEALHRCGDAGFDVIAGRSGSGSLVNLPLDKLIGLLEQLQILARDYDHVILDLGAGIERTVRHLAASAGDCIVVTTDEPTALTDAYAFIKLSVKQYRNAALRVVVNMASSEEEGRRTYGTLRKACQSFLGIEPPLAGVIPRDSRVREAIRAQTPLLTRHPSCPAAKSVEGLAAWLARGGPGEGRPDGS